ncbi:hypothetical protein M405DRAFT_938541 [Rhizopogon salebrosus TDB-379]|nr:hypothetical protein M405DRAFT_938541 [Rhizopogon salebrosus TDB-379]
MPLSAQDVREKFERFRILVVGRANAGKTTLLQKVCNTTEKPLIFDGKGNKIDADVVKSSVDRGYHDINNELVFQSNPGFVFHDSCGFEAGGVDEFKKMKEFVSERASTRKLNKRIHAIWQAIISMRLYLIVIFSLTGIVSQWMSITERSRRLRKGSSLSATPTMARFPVIAVFTKFDALSAVALGELRSTPGLTRKDIFEMTPKRMEEIFANANIWGRLCGTRYPPKNYVRLAQMNFDDTDCGQLLDCTTGALGDEALEMLLISTQQTNLELCITYAMKRAAMAYIKRARQGSLQLSEDECILMQKEIAKWFPHTGVSQIISAYGNHW